jgi:organic hydroperoxide reductase OsmC/OhrA
MQPDKVRYTAKVHTSGGREGAAHSSDGHLDIKLSPPGGAGDGTNPEQLFASTRRRYAATSPSQST